MALACGLLMATMPAAHANANNVQMVLVPSVTGLTSGYIYGSLIKSNKWLALVLSNLLISRCKDYIFKNFDTKHGANAKGSANDNGLLSGLSLTCESQTDNGGVQRLTYALNVRDDNKEDTENQYNKMSEYDDLVTIATVLVMLTC